jgi:hypothetical protein
MLSNATIDAVYSAECCLRESAEILSSVNAICLLALPYLSVRALGCMRCNGNPEKCH